MSRRDDLIGMLSSGRMPERIPFLFMGFHDGKSMHRLASADCWDEDTYYIEDWKAWLEIFSRARERGVGP